MRYVNRLYNTTKDPVIIAWGLCYILTLTLLIFCSVSPPDPHYQFIRYTKTTGALMLWYISEIFRSTTSVDKLRGLNLQGKAKNIAMRIMYPISCYYLFMYIAGNYVVIAAASPFFPPDHLFNSIDLFFGYNAGELPVYLARKFATLYVYGFNYMYGYGLRLLLIFGVIVGALFYPKQFKKVFFIILATTFFAIIISFFLPSIGPASVYPHIQMIEIKYLPEKLQFRAMHAGFVDEDVSMPSYHVLLSLYAVAMLWSKRKVLNTFLIVYFVLIIISIYAMGMHYIVDAVVSMCLFFAVLYATNRLMEKGILKL